MKTPGVYIQEKNAFSTTVVEAATAIPAFIGITEKAVNGSESLANKPWKITSMTEFTQYFGGAPLPVCNLSVAEPAETDADSGCTTRSARGRSDNRSGSTYGADW